MYRLRRAAWLDDDGVGHDYPPRRDVALFLGASSASPSRRSARRARSRNAHKRAALAEGLDPAIVAAIAAGERPAVLQPNAAALYRFCTEPLETKRVGDATFAAAKDAFGEQGIAEIIYPLGYYGLVAMLLNVDEHPLPEGVEPELRPLSRRAADALP